MLKKTKCRFARRCQRAVPSHWYLQHSMLKLHSANATVLFSLKLGLHPDLVSQNYSLEGTTGDLVRPPAQDRSNTKLRPDSRALSSWVLKSPMGQDPHLHWATRSQAQLHHSHPHMLKTSLFKFTVDSHHPARNLHSQCSEQPPW